MHLAAFPDYQMSGWDAVHHMAAFADLRASLCARGGCSDPSSDFSELLDVGCNLGGISLAAAANGFSSVCIEALPSNARRIEVTVKLNSHLGGRIRMCVVDIKRARAHALTHAHARAHTPTYPLTTPPTLSQFLTPYFTPCPSPPPPFHQAQPSPPPPPSSGTTWRLATAATRPPPACTSTRTGATARCDI